VASYAEARKRGFSPEPPKVIKPRGPDRRADANHAEVAARRALDASQHADEHALTAEQRAEAAAKDAAEAKACAEKAEAGLGEGATLSVGTGVLAAQGSNVGGLGLSVSLGLGAFAAQATEAAVSGVGTVGDIVTGRRRNWKRHALQQQDQQ
jgi:hypothetical protein